jgi:peptidoglycan/LPS O-acetylase OafA/YrhL
MFAFPAGLLLSRLFKPTKVRGAFWIGTVAIVVLAAVPRLGGAENLWMNGVYDAVCCIVVFPLLVYLAASGETTDKVSSAVCKFLGDISYPLYMVHYPFIYLYYAWVKNNDLTFRDSLAGALALFFGSIILAYVLMKLYDKPVRRWLFRKLLRK